MIIYFVKKTHLLCPFRNTISPFLVKKKSSLYASLNWLSGSGVGSFFLNPQSIVYNHLTSTLLKGCDPSFERS